MPKFKKINRNFLNGSTFYSDLKSPLKDTSQTYPKSYTEKDKKFLKDQNEDIVREEDKKPIKGKNKEGSFKSAFAKARKKQGPGGTFIAIDSSGLDRNASIDYRQPGGDTNNNLPFELLYDVNYDFSNDAKGVFPKFMDNSILFGGGTIGSSSNSNNYVKVTSSKKIDVKYIPPTSLSAITKATQTCGLTNGSSVASLDNTNGIGDAGAPPIITGPPAFGTPVNGVAVRISSISTVASISVI